MSSLLDRHLRIPKYLQLAEALRQKITSGELPPGSRLPSYVQMRQLHGATQNTVDKVFALLEQDGLITRERSRGTFVRTPAQQLAAGATGIIGISSLGFLVDGNSSYWTEILRGLRDTASRHGLQLLLLDHNAAAGWDKVDGLIVCDWGARTMTERLSAAQPCVSIMVDVPEMPSVVADDFSSGKTATEYLLSLGHRKIGVVSGADRSVMPLRLAGYRQALMTAGITPEDGWQRTLTGRYRETSEFTTSAAETMAAWLRNDCSSDARKVGARKVDARSGISRKAGTLLPADGCTAIVCQNDAVATGVVRAIREAGLDVPGDISVIGHDGTDLSRLSAPQLTTIALPLFEIGAGGMELLVNCLSGRKEKDEHRMLPVRLVERESTAPPPKPHES